MSYFCVYFSILFTIIRKILHRQTKSSTFAAELVKLYTKKIGKNEDSICSE